MPTLVKTFQKLLITLRMSSKALTVTYTAHPDPGVSASLVSSPLGLPLPHYTWNRQASFWFLVFLQDFCASAPSTNFSSVPHFH